MDAEESWHVIASQRRALAELLHGLPPEAWEQPSLCREWRIRDVAAHVALAPQPPGIGVILGASVKARGNFDRLNRDLAIAHAGRPTDALVQELRDLATCRRLPALTNHRNILFDVLVHAQDIAIPLGLAFDMPVDAARAGATTLWNMRWPWRPQRRFAGLRFVEENGPWSEGFGACVEGPISALLLLLTGRPAALTQVAGPGVAELERRLVGFSAAPGHQPGSTS